jgi:hypothetical protein
MPIQIPSDIGSLAGAVESVYGVDPGATRAVALTQRPGEEHNDAFPEKVKYRTTRNTPSSDRQHIDLGLTVNAVVTQMEDVVGGYGDHHPVFIAMGLRVTGNGVAAGTGNFITYGPQSSNFGSATFINTDIADNGQLSQTKYLGTRGLGDLAFDPDQPIIANLNSRSKHNFAEPFAAGSLPTDSGLDDVDAKCFVCTFDGNVVEIVQFSVNLNNEQVTSTVDIRTCNSGVDEIEIKNGTPTVEIRLKASIEHIDGLGVNDWVKQAHDTDLDVAFQARSDHGGQRFQFSAPKMRIEGFTKEPGDGDYLVWVLSCRLQDVLGDDSFEIRQEVL